MTQHEPESRPDAEEVLQQWHEIRASISAVAAFWRLHGRNEVAAGTMFLDTVSLFQSGARATQQVLRWATRSNSGA